MGRIWKFGDHVDTDQIVPGRFAPYMRPNEDVGNAAFIEARPDFNQNAQPGDILVAGVNFGCGSSREYAPLALKRRGIGGIIAISFARIFFRNAVNLGIPLWAEPKLFDAVEDGQNAELDVENGHVRVAGTGYPLAPLPAFARGIVREGGLAPYVLKHGRLPIGDID